MEEVCTQLDCLALGMVDDLENYLALHERLKSVLSTGYINISKSRYIMGDKAVSSLQLPTENSTLCPLALITEQTVTESSDDSSYVAFELASELANPNKSSRTPVQSDNLRRRIKDSLESGTSDEVESTHRPKNPLNWFGVLVPQSLRLAQTSFMEALNICVDLANLQRKLAHSQSRFHDKLSQKSESVEE